MGLGDSADGTGRVSRSGRAHQRSVPRSEPTTRKYSSRTSNSRRSNDPPGTAVIMTRKENLLTRHAVLAGDENTGSSGSFVFRTIKATMSVKDAEQRLERFCDKKAADATKKAAKDATKPEENREQLAARAAKKMRVRELKQELEKAGADSSGKKVDLVERLAKIAAEPQVAQL